MAITLEGGQKIVNEHSSELCAGRHCPLHNLSEHHMREYPQHFREDKGIVERICPHGVGHPDPDGHDYLVSVNMTVLEVHGCDGCCL